MVLQLMQKVNLLSKIQIPAPIQFKQSLLDILLLKKIINNSILKDLIQPQEINFINNLINPDKSIHQGYIYQIVSNTLNGLDVDKYDYLVRDSMSLGISIAFSFDKLINNAKVVNNKIVFPKHIDSDIINLFTTRHYMHRKIYSHKVVISIDILICQLMQLLEQELNIGQLLENLNENFINLTDDDILIRAKYSTNPDIKILINNIRDNYFSDYDKYAKKLSQYAFWKYKVDLDLFVTV